MANNFAHSKKTNLFSLLKEQRIEIPIIQRDYAQGRPGKEKLRNNFLDTLKSGIQNDPVLLDFVYGNTSADTMQPLDGQQRLTTLFLLHWYVAQKENKLDEEVKRVLKNFSYVTRSSSREFCRMLVEKSLYFDVEGTLLSDKIKKQSWFFKIWAQDPTISGMLTMLDNIEDKFSLIENSIWEKLITEDNNPISFYYMELEHFGLSDDLYIKMNARGRQLRDFENFKAGLDKRIEEGNWDGGRELEESFAFKADTHWINLLWDKLRDRNSEVTPDVDKAFMCFIETTLILFYAKESHSTNPKETQEVIRKIFRNPGEITPGDFSHEAYEFLYQFFELYHNYKYIDFVFDFPLWQYTEKHTTLFDVIINEGASYPQRVLFYAQSLFLRDHNPHEGQNQAAFNDWMRVVRNIVINQEVDDIENLIGAVRLVTELSLGKIDIYGFLTATTIKSGFAGNQMKDEVVKATIIQTKNDNNRVKPSLHKMEDTNFFKGRIRFALYCIDAWDEPANFNVGVFNKLCKVVSEHLNKLIISNTFRRAMFTIQDNRFYDYWFSYVKVLDWMPKRRIIESTKDLYEYAHNENTYSKRVYLKTLLMQLSSGKTLEEIIKLFINSERYKELPSWKHKVISEPKWLADYCQSHHIARPDDESHCYLLRTSRPRNMISCKRLD